MVKLHAEILPDPARCGEVYCDQIPLVFVLRFLTEVTTHIIFIKRMQAIFRKHIYFHSVTNIC